MSIICKWWKQWRDVIDSNLSLLVRPSVCVRVGNGLSRFRDVISGRSTFVRRSSARVTGFYTSSLYNQSMTCKVLDRLTRFVNVPNVFNSLPQDIRSTDNISTFCRHLKTFYFRIAFDQHWRHYPRLRFNIFCWYCSRKELEHLLTYLLTFNLRMLL